MTTREHQPSLEYFSGKTIRVKCEKGLAVHGKLIYYEIGDKKKHVPPVLILKTLDGDWLILRTWVHIDTSEV